MRPAGRIFYCFSGKKSMLNHNKLSKNLLNLHYSPENIVVTISKDGKTKGKISNRFVYPQV